MAGDTEPPHKRVRFSEDDGPSLESKAIIIRVGKAKQEFYVHEKLLRDSSEFFDKALKKEWKEGQEAAVDLPDTESRFFRAWVKFIYTGRVYIGEEEGDKMPGGEAKTQYAELALWHHLYGLGGFLQDGDFQDALIDAMVDWMTALGRVASLIASFIYSHTKRGSTHRQFVVDVFLNVWP